MKTLLAALLGCALVGHVFALDSTARITPEIRAQLDAEKKTLVRWAADPVIVSAVKAQNAQGPIPGMTNRKWRSLKPNDHIVKAFETNAAGVLLIKKMAASGDMVREAFLCAAQGEKAAFAQKPTNYLHKGEPKFDEPMKTGKVWEGVPEFDKSSHSHSVQLAAPVLDKGKPIGVLVIGVSMKMMKVAQ